MSDHDLQQPTAAPAPEALVAEHLQRTVADLAATVLEHRSETVHGDDRAAHVVARLVGDDHGADERNPRQDVGESAAQLMGERDRVVRRAGDVVSGSSDHEQPCWAHDHPVVDAVPDQVVVGKGHDDLIRGGVRARFEHVSSIGTFGRGVERK